MSKKLLVGGIVCTASLLAQESAFKVSPPQALNPAQQTKVEEAPPARVETAKPVVQSVQVTQPATVTTTVTTTVMPNNGSTPAVVAQNSSSTTPNSWFIGYSYLISGWSNMNGLETACFSRTTSKLGVRL